MLRDRLQTTGDLFPIAGEVPPTPEITLNSPWVVQHGLEQAFVGNPAAQANNLLVLLNISTRVTNTIHRTPGYEAVPLLGGDPEEICASLVAQLWTIATAKDETPLVPLSEGMYRLYGMLTFGRDDFRRRTFDANLAQIVDVLHKGNNMAHSYHSRSVLNNFIYSVSSLTNYMLRGPEDSDYIYREVRDSLDPALLDAYLSPRKWGKRHRAWPAFLVRVLRLTHVGNSQA